MKDTGKSLAFTPITHVPHLRFPYLCKQVSTFISFFYILSVSWIFFFFFFDYITPHVGSDFHDQGSNPHPLQWKLKMSTPGPPRKSSCEFLYASRSKF